MENVLEDLMLLGLTFNIFGATFLVAPLISRKDWDRITRSESSDSIKRKKRRALIGWICTFIGFIFLFIGFVLQFLSISWS